jgi:hypothetical protein
MPSDLPLGVLDLERDRKWAFRRWWWLHLPRLWLLGLVRVLRAASRASSLFLTIFGALISAIALAFALPGRDLPARFTAVVLLFASLLSAFLAAGFAVLRMLPPAELARFLVEGRKTREILEILALRIRRLAMKFVAKTAKVSDLPADLLRVIQERPPEERFLLLAEAEKAIRGIDKLSRRQDINFRRIDALKKAAARELDLSYRSLCDHVLQFSPAMFRVGVDKYQRNLDEMVELTSAKDFEDADASRFQGLIDQNKRLEDDCRFRARAQELLLRFDDLHGHIRSLASTRSTSGSLQAYSRALADIASKSCPHLAGRSWRRGWRRWSGSVRDVPYAATRDRFGFLYRRQRAHPGFSLHTLLAQAVEVMATKPFTEHFDQKVVGLQRQALSALDRDSEAVEAIPPAKGGDPPTEDRHSYLARLFALSEIHRYFNRAVSLSRSEMREGFGKVLDAWWARVASGAVVYLVTAGYSKTVRELIRHALGARWDEPGRDHPPWRPHLYQLLAGDDEELDSRLMVWELRDLWTRERWRPASGSGEMLVSLTRPGDRVMLLLGAEAVDSDRRVVHPRSVLERLQPVLDRLSGAQVPTLVVVAAESFKRLQAPFATGPFYRGHFERVGVYEAELVDLVLSDRGTDPADWQSVVDGRLAGAGGAAASASPGLPAPPR